MAGGEEHKILMKKAILAIQDSGNFAFTTVDRNGFDVGEIKAKTRSAWDAGMLTIYECQTNAIRSELEKSVAKAKRLNANLIFTVPSDELANTINVEFGNEYNAMVV